MSELLNVWNASRAAVKSVAFASFSACVATSDEHRFDAVNRYLLPQLQTDSLRRVEIYGADARAGIQEKIKRLV